MKLFTGSANPSSTAFCLIAMVVLAFAPMAYAQGLDFMMMTDSLPDVQFGDAAWADFDADGDLDMAISGSGKNFLGVGFVSTYLFINLRDTTYEVPMQGIIFQTVYRSPTGEPGPFPPTSLEGVWQSSVAWGDYDNDGDVDLATNGLDRAGQVRLRLHENIGDGIRITERFDLPGTRFGDMAWGDYDNDGDLDLVITGIDGTEQYITRIYENKLTETGAFQERDAGLKGLAYSSARWGDYDADGDLDLLISGVAQPQAFETHVYRNDGFGLLTDIGASFDALLYSSAAWGDYDNDGDLDIALSGGQISPFFYRGSLRIYRNDSGSFSSLGLDLPGGYQGGVNWGDYDNDGDPDVLASGGTVRNLRSFQISRNDGGGAFTPDESFQGLGFGTSFFGDYDHDGDLDIFGLGQALNGNPFSNELRNQLPPPNTPPTAPGGLQAVTTSDGITFSWNPASDAETPAAGLTYNLRVGSSPGGNDIVSAMAQASGERLLTARGNVGAGTTWSLRVPPGVYFWSVQAVDAAYEGSAFAEEQRTRL